MQPAYMQVERDRHSHEGNAGDEEGNGSVQVLLMVAFAAPCDDSHHNGRADIEDG